MYQNCVKKQTWYLWDNGEDGKVQATFDLLGIGYTGTDYLSSAISMSKELAKKVLVPEGIPMPKGVTLHKGHKIEYVPFPCVVKPCCGGSSVGVSIAHNEKEFEEALNEAFSYEDTVLVEEFVDGREFSVAVLDGKALPVIEIEPLEGFYDYKNKYKAGSTKETCPANIPEDIASQMQLKTPEIPESFNVNSMLSSEADSIQKAYSSATNSAAFSSVKNNISISDIFSKARSGVSSKSLASTSTLKSMLSQTSGSNKSSVLSEYNKRKDWLSDKNSSIKQNTRKYQLQQKLAVSDADQSIIEAKKKTGRKQTENEVREEERKKGIVNFKN